MKKILIIEDEKTLSEMYKFKFTKEGYEAVTAKDVEESFRVIKEGKPDLIFLDILLPGENGIAFLKKRIGMTGVEDIPVIILSNFDDKETREKAFKLGAKDYLIKANYDPKEIIEKIKAQI